MSDLWQAVLVALDARASGRESVAREMFGEDGSAHVDVAHVYHSHSHLIVRGYRGQWQRVDRGWMREQIRQMSTPQWLGYRGARNARTAINPWTNPYTREWQTVQFASDAEAARFEDHWDTRPWPP